MQRTKPSSSPRPIPSAPQERLGFHPDNVFRQAYDWDDLLKVRPTLRKHIQLSPRGDRSLDFANPDAIFSLNHALLKRHFGLEHWSLLAGSLCPPVPSRWDYLLRLRELLQQDQPQQTEWKGWDIGCGSNLIYTLLGHLGLKAQMVGSDIDAESLAHAQTTLDANKLDSSKIELRHQSVSHQLFEGILQPEESFDFCVCNPPFHASEKEAEAAAQRKLKNLQLEAASVANSATASSFSGRSQELWCKGGETAFLKKLLKESVKFSTQIRWFSSLVSKPENVDAMVKFLKKAKATKIEILPLDQGNKKTRVVAWTFQGKSA